MDDPEHQHQPQTPWQQSDQHMPYGQQSGYAGYQQPHYAQQPGYQQQYGQHSAYAAWSQQQAATQTQQLPGAEGQPTWAAPVGTATQAPPRPGRGRKIFAAGAAAVLIALAAGGVGAATVLALDDGNGSSPTVKTGNSVGHPGGRPLLAGPDRRRGAGQRRVDHHRAPARAPA